MKTIGKITVALAFFFALNNTYAQDERKLDYFDAITVAGDVELVLIRGEEARAVITAEGISEDDVTVYVKGKTLKIQLIEGLFKGSDHARVEVTYQQLRALKASAGAKASSTAAIIGDQLDLRASSGAQMDLAVEVNALVATATEGAVIEIEGSTETQEVTTSTGGQYRGLDLQCARTYVKANTGGQAEVVATKSLDASANTGGQIDYTGDPEEKNTRSLISGGIQKI
ncbi:MAG: DUF2807 domain-containing protein [Lewinellaceae bacterium]|nr:DUF2807 domain-containing protein [Phaeodactylibacter sp.]MCB9039975.1 DUF2807 domain-containing protein [Lewinellaceae bacterium]